MAKLWADVGATKASQLYTESQTTGQELDNALNAATFNANASRAYTLAKKKVTWRKKHSTRHRQQA